MVGRHCPSIRRAAESYSRSASSAAPHSSALGTKPRAPLPTASAPYSAASRVDVMTTTGAPGAAAQLGRDREAARVGQLQVEQHQVGREALRGGDARRAVRGLADHREALGLEQPARPGAEPAVVVDDQHRGPHSPRILRAGGASDQPVLRQIYAERASGRTNHRPTITAASAAV